MLMLWMMLALTCVIVPPALLIAWRWGGVWLIGSLIGGFVACFIIMTSIVAGHTCAVGYSTSSKAHLIFGRIQLLGFLVLVIVSNPAVWVSADHTPLRSRPLWTALTIPSQWFTSYLELSMGHHGKYLFVRLGMSLVIMALLVWATVSKTSLRGLARLAHFERMSDAKGSSTRTYQFDRWLDPDTCNIALLAVRHLQRDYSFRLAALGILPGIVIPFILGFAMADVMSGLGLSHVSMWIMSSPCISLLPALWYLLSRTSSARAAWVFRATPVLPSSIIVAGQRVLLLSFVWPYAVLVGVAGLLIHTSKSALMANGVLLSVIGFGLSGVVALRSRRLPFASPFEPVGTANSLWNIMAFACIGLIAMSIGLLLYDAGPLFFSSGLIVLVAAVAFIRARLRAADWRLQE